MIIMVAAHAEGFTSVTGSAVAIGQRVETDATNWIKDT